MSRNARNGFGSKYVHVIVQGINKEFIFDTNELKNAYRSILRKKLEDEDVHLLAYCIMGNHAHMLFYSDYPERIITVMHRTNTAFAKLYNMKKNRMGYVFRDRYYSQAIYDEEQLENCMIYIHNNPVKANMVKKPLEYKFSSFREYCSNPIYISNDSLKLMKIRRNKGFADYFDEIHQKTNIENISDIVEYVPKEVIIKEYIEKYHKFLYELCYDKTVFKNLLTDLRHRGGVNLREMERIFGISKSTLSEIMNRFA